MNATDMWRTAQSEGLTVIDIRDAAAYEGSHLLGLLNGPLDAEDWTEAVTHFLHRHQVSFMLFSADEGGLLEAERRLGTQSLICRLSWAHGPAMWSQAGGPLVSCGFLEVDDLVQGWDQYTIIDVREPDEWRKTGIIPGARMMSLGALTRQLDQLSRDPSYAVICAHGHRSQVGAGLLADHGFRAWSVNGGMARWMETGGPMTSA